MIPTADNLPRLLRVQTWYDHFLWLGTAAVLYGLSFPRPGLWPLAYVAMFFFAWAAASAVRLRTLFWMSLVVSFAWWLVMLWWLSHVTLGGMATLALVCALYWVAAAVGVRVVVGSFPTAPMVLLFPAVWMSSELIRGCWPTGGFSWFCLSHTQACWLPGQEAGHIVQFAELFSQYGVSFVIAMPAGAAVDVLRGRHVQRWRWPRLLWPAGLAVLVLAGVWLYGDFKIGNVEPDSDATGPVVAIVQTNIEQSTKNRPAFDTDRHMWDQLVALTRTAAAHEPRPDLIIWPETSVPATLNPAGIRNDMQIAAQWRGLTPDLIDQLTPASQASIRRTAEQMGQPVDEVSSYITQWYSFKATRAQAIQELADELDLDLLVGGPTRVSDEPVERYNSVYHFPADAARPDGPRAVSGLLRYDKMHRVPFGEYIPWVDQSPTLKQWFIKYLTPHDQDYTLTAGKGPVAFRMDYKFHDQPRELTFVAPICFEDAFPRICRRLVYADGRKKATFMANLTNDGWYPGTAQGPQHVQLATLRCIEMRTPMARSVNTGISGFIDAAGRVVQVVEQDGQTQQITGTAVRRIALNPRQTGYGAWGRWPLGVVAAAVGVIFVVALLRSWVTMPGRVSRSENH